MAFNLQSLPTDRIKFSPKGRTDEVTLSVTVDKFYYSDYETNFFIATVTNLSKLTTQNLGGKLYPIKKFSILGYSLLFIETITEGQEVSISGFFEIGRDGESLQFKVESFIETIPTKPKSIESFLSSGKISGIGLRTARKIVSKYGSNTINVLNENIDDLISIDGITLQKLTKIKESWEKWKEIYHIVDSLKALGVGDSASLKAYYHFGSNVVEMVKSDPYILTEVHSIGFKTADSIALKMGLSQSNPQRIKKCLIYCIEDTIENGHTSYTYDSTVSVANELLSVDSALIEDELNRLIEERVAVQTQKEINGHIVKFISYYKTYGTENRIAKELAKINLIKDELDLKQLSLINDFIISKESLLDDSQLSALRLILSNKISVLTGGPGTGKTHTIKTIIEFIQSQEQTAKIVLCAPTGRAAKRMQESTGLKSSTIHRLLGYKDGGFIHNEFNKLKGRFFIIDESSMIDVWLANSLIKAIPNDASILFVGDYNQLPSVGAGNFFKDLIHSDVYPVAKLNRIHRQAFGSDIILAAHDILNRKIPTLNSKDTNSDFIFIDSDFPEDILDLTLKEINELLLKGVSPSDIQVLTPKKETVIGTYKLNQSLRTLFNPTSTEGSTFSDGDRVMQTKNNPELGIYNGDIGIIVSIDKEEGFVNINFDGKIIAIPNSEMHDIIHSYAITIHKSQGSDYPYVIIPVSKAHSFMWDSNLLYTAITRGKLKVILIGDKKTLNLAIGSNKQADRITNLMVLIKHQNKIINQF